MDILIIVMYEEIDTTKVNKEKNDATKKIHVEKESRSQSLTEYLLWCLHKI